RARQAGEAGRCITLPPQSAHRVRRLGCRDASPRDPEPTAVVHRRRMPLPPAPPSPSICPASPPTAPPPRPVPNRRTVPERDTPEPPAQTRPPPAVSRTAPSPTPALAAAYRNLALGLSHPGTPCRTSPVPASRPPGLRPRAEPAA